jgi:hypothetical protein
MTHTPGPWEVSGYHVYAEVGDLRRDGYDLHCVVDRTDGRTNEEADANARLISAAPDLLRLLKELQPILWNDGPLVKAYRHLAGGIEAAIAKAEGRTI